MRDRARVHGAQPRFGAEAGAGTRRGHLRRGQQGIEVHEYAASEVKQAVVGGGRADKTQVQHMVGVLLGLKGPIQADAGDALAVA